MKLVRRTESNDRDRQDVFFHQSIFSVYGTKFHNKKRICYTMEVVCPGLTGIHKKTYTHPTKKPFFRRGFLASKYLRWIPWLYFFDLLVLPVILMFYVVFAITCLVWFIANYPVTILIEQTFFTKKWEFVMGWAWVGFGLLGMYTLIRFFI